jgi:predicted Rossmann-fold nucleotide-binding protein
MDKVFEKRYDERKKEYDTHREVITVFSSASNEAPIKFKKLCRELGYKLAKNEYKMSYGGSRNGCGRWLVDGAEKSGKGNIRAVKYSDWPVNDRMENPPKGMRTEIVQTGGPDLFMRMAELKKDALACIVLPGGPATLEEMWNAIGGVAEFGPLPVIIVNIDKFYESAKEQMEKMADYFYWPKYNKYVVFVDNVDEAIQHLNTMRYLKIIQRGKKPYIINAKRGTRKNPRKYFKKQTKHFKKQTKHFKKQTKHFKKQTKHFKKQTKHFKKQTKRFTRKMK